MTTQSDSDYNSKTEVSPDVVPSTSKAIESPIAKKKKKSRCQSVEDRLDTMSSTLLAMTELLKQQGICSDATKMTGNYSKQPKDDKGQKDKVKAIELTKSNSETTIYKNALDELKDGMHHEIVVDPEITLRVSKEVDEANPNKKENRESSSSDECIDTSDELMEIEMDINDKFIADCQEEANRRKHSYSAANDGIEDMEITTDKPSPKMQAEQRICEAEASKLGCLLLQVRIHFVSIVVQPLSTLH